MKEYRDLVTTVLTEGTLKPNRTGEDTLSLFHYSYKLDLRDGFPLLTGKKINFDNILFELLWFLGGDSKIDFLHKHGISFWNQWDEGGGQLPKAYGEYWRAMPCADKYRQDDGSWYFDQFKSIIEELKTNPNSRRMVLTNWYPPSAWKAKLPPCHLMCIFNVQYDQSKPYLNLEMFQRSCDVPVGVPFNIASYALLLKLVGNIVNMPVRYFGHTLVDVHIYQNQLPAVYEYMRRDPRELPELNITERLILERLDDLIKNGSTEEIKQIFSLEDYDPHPFIKMPVMV